MAVLLAISSIPFASPATATALNAVESQGVQQPASASFADATNPDSALAVPLANPGAAEVQKRAKLQTSLGRAFREAASDPDSAGAYLDDDAVPVFLTAGDSSKLRRAVVSHIPDHVASRFERVRNSTRELKALQGRINKDLRAGKLQDDGITSTAIDTRANAIVVGSSRVTDALRSKLVKAYGEGVLLAFEAPSEGGDACASRKSCPPAKAGLEIRSTYNTNVCTTGPIVRVAASSALRILTAGHCLALNGGTGTTRKWTHNGSSVGWSEYYAWSNGTNADVGLINPNTTPVTGDRNLLYRASGTDIVGLRGWKPTAEQVQGSVVCRAGAASGYICGTVILTDRTKDVDGRSIDHQWVVNYDACPGDSGAPYLLDTIVWGIHTDSTAGCNPGTNQAWYSPMGWVSTVLSSVGHPIEMCTDPTCASSANTWRLRGTLNDDVWNPRMVKLLDGRVLQVGGASGDLILAASPDNQPRAPQTYHPATGAWSDTAPPPWLPARCAGQFAVRLSDGRVLVGGGTSTSGGDVDPCAATAHIFNPSNGPAGSWTTVAPMPQSIQFAGAVVLGDGRAFVTGGAGTDGKTSIALAYAPTSNTWATLTPAPGAGIAPLVLRLNDGRVLVSGGYTITDPTGPRYAHTAATYLFNPTNGTWASTTNVGARGVVGLVLADGRVAVAGGQRLTWDGGQRYAFSTDVSVFDPTTNKWTQLAPLRTGRAHFTLAQLKTGQLLAAAGLTPSTSEPSGGPSGTADIYDWATNAWYAGAGLQDARAEQGSAVLDNGTVLVAGGGIASSETYTPGDVTPPSVGTPLTSLATATAIGNTAVPVRVTWTATDAGGSGLGTYDIARSTDGGAYTTVGSYATSASFSTLLPVGHTYRFQVRGRDNAGNAGPWRPGTTIEPRITQQTSPSMTYAGTWATSTSSSYSGGTVRYASKAGASATYRFTGRSIAFLSTRASARGSARIYVDGVLVSTVSLYAGSTTFRYVAFQKT